MKKILIPIIIVIILAMSLFHFNEYKEKNFFQALRVNEDKFLNSDLYYIKQDEHTYTKIENEKLEELTSYLSKYKLQRLSDKEFSESFTPQYRIETIRNEKYFIDIYEDFIMIGIIKDSMKFYKIIGGKEYFEHIKTLLEE